MSACDDIMGAIGKTPAVKLARLFRDAPFAVYAKLEMLNPGGSVKDRPAIDMLRAAQREGKLREGSVVVESSSGNLAIGLAQACNLLGCRFVCVVDPRTTQANLRLLRAYGARIDLVSRPDPATSEFVPARLNRVRRWLRRLPDAFWPNQYANPHNAAAHQRTTMAELAADVPAIDYLFLGVSTCGTLRGCIDYIREHGLATRVIAVDAAGSVIFGRPNAGVKRHLPGIGAGIQPALKPAEGVHDVVTVSDRDSIHYCRLLARRESIVAGGSSGGVVAAVAAYRERIAPGSICAVLLPDRGERYLDTIYDDGWVNATFGPAFLATLRSGSTKGDNDPCDI
ncbi:MAG: 2,3-diaminopropionate biosynthesis protein SbnA [Paenibacillaceae bacterium]|nr:2,3-diaminopropionate biosynthesis protein SbnA [Paenibacillaceae bacterium]